ncbi:MAG: iron-sulfur cluster assembly scaffold protein [Chloroflexota bacterium]|nr:iron-sulfur cluster assembly scaffold protein [Chloroflexota bacterium]
MPSELESTLKKWAEEALESIGVSKAKVADFAELQDKLIENMRATYSERTIDFFLTPRNLGKMKSPDGFARATGSCGDTIEIYLRAKNGEIMDARFTTDGCGTSIASGGMVTEMVKGKSVVEAQEIDQGDVLNALEGLPEESEHCALLATDTLKEAIRNYLASKNEARNSFKELQVQSR